MFPDLETSKVVNYPLSLMNKPTSLVQLLKMWKCVTWRMKSKMKTRWNQSLTLMKVCILSYNLQEASDQLGRSERGRRR